VTSTRAASAHFQTSDSHLRRHLRRIRGYFEATGRGGWVYLAGEKTLKPGKAMEKFPRLYLGPEVHWVLS